MNCQDINRILDASAAGDLSQAQNDAIRQHLDSCHACSEDWASWNELIAMPVPATPAGLFARIAAALPAQSPSPVRRPLRPFLIGGALVAGFALAATAVWQTADRSPQSVIVAAKSQEIVASAPAVPESVTPAPATIGEQPDTEVTIEEDESKDINLDPRTVVVVKRPEVAADAKVIAVADRCHDALVSELRALGGVNIVTDSSDFRTKSITERFNLPERDRKIGRRRGAASVLTVTTEMSCQVTLSNAQTGALIAGSSFGGADPQGMDMYLFARHVAKGIHAELVVDRRAEFDIARATLLNAASSDVARSEALATLIRARNGSGMSKDDVGKLFDKDVIAAAIQLGTKASDPGMRVSAWVALREIKDLSLVQPLLQSLANDPDNSVRMQVAYTLKKYLDTPGVREGLLQAAANDPDSQPKVVCCIETVREAAERASIPDAEFRAWVLRKLFDESLPARSRLFALQPFAMNGLKIQSVGDIGEDETGVVFQIGQREADPVVRNMAWRILEWAIPNKEFVPILLGDLRNHPDEYVRATAAKVLRRHVDVPEVREALERASTDSSMEVRRAAAAVQGAARPPE